MQAIKVMPRASRGLALVLLVTVAVLAALLSPVAAGAAVTGVPQKPKTESLGMDAVQVSWSKVTGATRYQVQYATKSSFSGAKTYERKDKPAEPVAYLTGLTRNTKYYFRVYAITADNVKSKASTAVNATPKYQYGSVDAIKTTNVGGTFVESEWSFNDKTLGTPAWRIRAEAAANSKDVRVNDIGSDSNGKVSGLKKNTTYYIQIASLLPKEGDAPAVRVGPYSKAIKVKTSSYAVDGPSDLKMIVQNSYYITLGWTPPKNIRAGDQYVVQYARNTSMSGAATVSRTATTSKKVTGLKSNVNYFMRVYVVDASGKKVSDSSDVIQTKTPTARGTITGNVSGIPSSARKDLVVTAYATKSGMSDKNNLVAESDVQVNSNGNYTLAVRPGTYRVQVSYTGSANYTSLWAGCSQPSRPVSPGCTSNGSPIYVYGKNSTVSANIQTTAQTVTLGTGGRVSGVVKDSAGKPLKSVDVTARSCWSEGSDYKRDVMAMTQTTGSGGYQLSGLADGWYWLRFVYNRGDGFAAYAAAVKLTNHQVVAARPSGDSCLKDKSGSPIAKTNVTLSPKDFRKKYALHVYGSRKVGTTLKSKFNKWIGDQYGTSATYSKMSWVWTRDGKNIGGTSGSTTTNSSGSRDYCSRIRCTPSYKLKSADRKHYVSLKVTYSRYGYFTQTKTYKKFKVR